MSKNSVHAIPESEKFIDIEKAIGSKNPTLLKVLPKFLIKYIKRTIHQNELNNAIWRNRTRLGHDFVDAAMEEFGVKTRVIGAENIPAEGGVIMTANHPLGGLDGIAFMDVAGEHRKDIKFFVNDLLMALKNFTPIFIPVNKHGRNSPEYVHRFEEIYASSDCLLLFPAGLVSRKQSGKGIQDLVWKKSFITKSIQYKKNVVPVFIDGNNSKFFYNLAYWRKRIGIKANMEMFYLVDEMYKQKGKTLTFTFGEPISWQTFTKDHPAEYWSEKVKQHTYALQTNDKSRMLPTIKNNPVSK
ncbi:MAG TPA: 1-acyl-sn-glycerol-3-phosphate acyltransferase [Bacteroidia bacterium]|jgi:putative hemolysin|nr:1-acyl-sn-glycerol-3-phosphate acyltransferase [Bacteroidia bacterium]